MFFLPPGHHPGFYYRGPAHLHLVVLLKLLVSARPQARTPGLARHRDRGKRKIVEGTRGRRGSHLPGSQRTGGHAAWEHPHGHRGGKGGGNGLCRRDAGGSSASYCLRCLRKTRSTFFTKGCPDFSRPVVWGGRGKIGSGRKDHT